MLTTNTFGRTVHYAVVKNAELRRRKTTSTGSLHRFSDQLQLQRIIDEFVHKIKPISREKSSKQSELWEDPEFSMKDMDRVRIVRGGPNKGGIRIDL